MLVDWVRVFLLGKLGTFNLFILDKTDWNLALHLTTGPHFKLIAFTIPSTTLLMLKISRINPLLSLRWKRKQLKEIFLRLTKGLTILPANQNHFLLIHLHHSIILHLDHQDLTLFILFERHLVFFQIRLNTGSIR